MKKLSFLTKCFFKTGLLDYLFNNYSFYSDNELNEDFIRQYKDKVDWLEVSWYQKLSEGFVREFRDELFLDLLKNTDNYSESFIREFKDELNWLYLSERKNLSEEFIIEFQDYLDFDSLITNSYQYSEYIQRFIVEKLYNTENVDVEAYYKDMTNYMKNHFEKIRMLS